MEPARDQHRTALVGAAVAVVVWGASGVTARKIDLPPSGIALYRFAVFGLALVAWMALRRTPMTRRALWGSLPGGLCLAADVYFYFYAVKHTSITNATLIGSLQPLLIMAVSVPMYGEKPARRDVLAALVALAGVAGVVVIGSGQPTWSGLGDLAAAGATVSWGAYFIASRHAQKRLTSVEFTTGTSLWTAVFNVPIALVTGQSLAAPKAGDWPLVLFVAFGVGLFGSALMNWAIPHLPLWLSSVMTLIIPIVAAFLAWWILDETLTVAQILAMGVVLAALAFIVVGQAAPSPPNTEPAEVAA